MELVCTERWWNKENSGGSGDGKLESRSVLTNPLIQSFIADAEFTTSEPVVRYARFQIPTAAPPTVKGSVAGAAGGRTERCLLPAERRVHHFVPSQLYQPLRDLARCRYRLL